VDAQDSRYFQSENEDAASNQSEPVKKADLKTNLNTGKSQFFGDANKFKDAVRPRTLSNTKRGLSLG
jgi:hypothetical protein